jgi:hypothetical protein
MGPTRLRFTMIGFILGVVIVYLKELPISEGSSLRQSVLRRGARSVDRRHHRAPESSARGMK